MEWSERQFRAAYHFNRFTTGWRKLVVFYVAMTLAGYAQVIHAFIFYAAWGSLVLMYWEPYLSPPFPWTSDTRIKDSFGVLLQLGFSSTESQAGNSQEIEAVQQWVLAIQRGLNETQLRVYKLLFGAILIPFAFLLVGVVQQATSPKYAAERQAVYASALLLALMTVYTVCVLACLWIFHRVQAQESEESRAHEVSWQPQDMMFFMCKILGETLNTVVSTLVAGSFTAFMPWPIFWLCILITSLSYTATNLLYDFDSDAVVQDDPAGGGCGIIKKLTPTTSKQQQQQQQWDALVGTESAESQAAGFKRDDSAQLPCASTTHGSKPRPLDDTGALSDCAAAAAEAGQYQQQQQQPPACAAPAAAAESAAAAAAAGGCQDASRQVPAAEITRSKAFLRFRLKRDKREKKPKKPPSPPFLAYKWPRGARGRAIVWLLLAVCMPSAVLLMLVAKGFGGGSKAEWYLSDPDGKCAAEGDSCLARYQQLLVILGCLGCLISYYAFTIGFLGAGPVTWLYQVLRQATK